MKQVRFIDLFVGCNGLLEGFIQAGYAPVVHVEMDEATKLPNKIGDSYG